VGGTARSLVILCEGGKRSRDHIVIEQPGPQQGFEGSLVNTALGSLATQVGECRNSVVERVEDAH
jgi:hypothetical protein